MRDLWRTIKYSSRFKMLTLTVLGISFVMNILGLIQPYILKLFFDLMEKTIKSGLVLNVQAEFIKYTGLYFTYAFTTILIGRINTYFWIRWINWTERKLTTESFEHVQQLSLEYFTRNQTGKIIERISKGIGDAMRIVENVVFEFVPQLFYFILATIILFKIDYRFGIIVGLGVPIYATITILFNKNIFGFIDNMRDAYERLGAVRTESITNVRTVKSYAQETSQAKKVLELMNEKVGYNMAYAKVINLMYALRGITLHGSQFLALTLGIYFVINQKMSLGTFVLVWTYTTRCYDPMNRIMRIYDDTVQQLRSVRRLYETLDEKPMVVDIENAKNLTVRQGRIDINNVEFAYSDGDGKQVIKGIDLVIEPKTTVAIVGKSGSGKTTLAKLFMRFYDPTKGEILIDGKNISHVTQKSLRDKIAYVLQDSLLFNDTTLNNIRFGRPNATEKEVIKAAKIANAHEFIEKLPKGYKTIVGERGVKLSGGEQQRINIARAVLKNAPILILDEATSSLDSESEMVIQDALNNLIKNKTTIIIAHRLATIMRADMIVVMDKGKIAEIGTHADLVEKKGIYSRLFDIQSGAFLLEDDDKDSKLVEKVAA